LRISDFFRRIDASFSNINWLEFLSSCVDLNVVRHNIVSKNSQTVNWQIRKDCLDTCSDFSELYWSYTLPTYRKKESSYKLENKWRRTTLHCRNLGKTINFQLQIFCKLVWRWADGILFPKLRQFAYTLTYTKYRLINWLSICLNFKKNRSFLNYKSILEVVLVYQSFLLSVKFFPKISKFTYLWRKYLNSESWFFLLARKTLRKYGMVRESKIPIEIQEIGRRKLRMLNNSQNLTDLQIPPSNKLEKLKGTLKEFYSIRVNNQWRIIFKWHNGNASDVEIVDYH